MKRINKSTNRMIFRLFGIAFAALTLTGCCWQPDISVKHYEIVTNSRGEPRIHLAVLTDPELVERAKENHVLPAGVFHICDHVEEFGSGQYLKDALNTRPGEFTFEFPATLKDLVVFPPSGGEIKSGWPRELTEKQGVCFQIRGGSYGWYIRSSIIQVAGLEHKLIE
jgi:hypothetical protein